MMAAMDEETTIWIKQEEMVDMPNDPDSMALKDPLDFGETSIHVKQEHEFKPHVDGFEHNHLRDPLDVGETSLHVKQEHGLKDHVDDFEHNDIKDPLSTGEPSFQVEKEHESMHNVDGSGVNVPTSTGSESDSTRLIQDSSESYYISSEETIKEEVVPSELERGAGESTSFTMSGIHMQQTEADNEDEEEEENENDSLFGIRLRCSLRDKEFHSFSCSFCLRNFTSKYRLIMHVFIHIDGVEPPTYVCESCGEVFCTDASLSRHVKMSADVQAPFDAYNYKCGHFYNNEKIVEGDKEVSFKSFTELGTLKRHASINTASNPHKCGICSKYFRQLDHLKKHSLIHTGIKPHKCHICGKSFTWLEFLAQHSQIHTGTITHKCDICGKSFRHLVTLKRHLLIHTGPVAHECDICGKSFTKMSQLKYHSLNHTGLKPHKCDICGKSFARLSGLNRHFSIHTGVKPHKCNACGKSFTVLGNLKRHSVIHNRKTT